MGFWLGGLKVLVLSLALVTVPLPLVGQSVNSAGDAETVVDVGEQVRQYLAQSRQAVEQEDYEQALEISQQALKLALESGDEGLVDEIILYQLDDVYWKLNRYYREEDNYVQALATAEKGLELSRQVNSQTDERVYSLRLVWSYGDKGWGYRRDNEYERSVEAYKLAVSAAEELLQLAKEDENVVYQSRAYEEISSAYSAISYTYNDYGQALATEGEFEEAHTKLDLALRYGEGSTQPAEEAIKLVQLADNENVSENSYWSLYWAYRSIADALGQKGFLYTVNGQLNKALVTYQKALEVLQKGKSDIEASENLEISIPYRLEISEAYEGIGSAYEELEDYSQGLLNYQKAVEIAEELQAREKLLGAFRGISVIYSQLIDYYSESADYSRSSKYVDKLAALSQQGIDLARMPAQTENNTSLFNALRTQDVLDSEEEKKNWASVFKDILYLTFLKGSILYGEQGDYDTSLEFSEKSLNVARELGILNYEMIALGSVFTDYKQLSRYEDALATASSMIQLSEQSDNPKHKINALLAYAVVYENLGNFQESLTYYKQILSLSKELEFQDTESTAVIGIARIYSFQGKYDLALELFNRNLLFEREVRQNLEQSNASEYSGENCYLNQVRESNNEAEEIHFPNGRPEGVQFDAYSNAVESDVSEYERQLCIENTWDSEATLLTNIAYVYADQGKYEDALVLLNKAEEISFQWNSSLSKKATIINNKASLFGSKGEYGKAIKLYKEALEISKRIEEPQGIAIALSNLGLTYFQQGAYDEALYKLQKALAIVEEIGALRLKPVLLDNIGEIYDAKGQYFQADKAYKQALVVSEELGLLSLQADHLKNLSELSANLGAYDISSRYIEDSLILYEKTGERIKEAAALRNSAVIHEIQGEFAQALAINQESLGIMQDLGDVDGEAEILISLGSTYIKLGEYEKTNTLYVDALDIFRKIGSLVGEGKALNALGELAYRQSNYVDAQNFYQRALKIYQDTGNIRYETISQMNLGFAQLKSGNLSAAEKALTRALKLQRDVQARAQEGEILRGLALVSQAQNDTADAVDLLQQSLAIHRELGDLPGEAKAFSDLGKLYAKQDQPALAAVFLKQAVNTYEGIRKENRVLDQDLQSSYTETVADTYRQLADVLLTQGRIPEAQRVIELLKIEELREFTSQTRAAWTSDGISLTALEQEIEDTHGSLIALGQALENCETESCSSDDRRLLIDQRNNLRDQYREQFRQLEAAYGTECQQIDKICADVNLETLGSDSSALLEANEDSVLVYPLVVDDKLWLLWVAENNVVGSIEVKTTDAAAIADTVYDFRQALDRSNPHNTASLEELNGYAQKLYDWLIRPLEAELTANQIKHIIFTHDRYTRYIPMAVLHDGNQYLIEKYAVSSILAAEITNTDQPENIAQAPVLGLGLSDAAEGFSALPNVPEELDTIVQESPSDAQGTHPGKVFLNKVFNRDLLFYDSEIEAHEILHIATHAKFEPGSPGDSFLVLGDKTSLPIPEIDNLQTELEGVHLVVLSACETAFAEQGSDGREITGISSYFIQANRADAVIASLWNVNDASTSVLMQRFYEFLATGELTKAEALQQAQLSLLYDQDVETRMDAVRASLLAISSETGQPLVGNTPISHPYHWAPFVIIGNAL